MKTRFAVTAKRYGYMTTPKAADVVYRQTHSCFADYPIDAWKFNTESEAIEVAESFRNTLWNPAIDDVVVISL